MGNSFKLQSGGDPKSQAKSVGALLLALSIPIFFLFALVPAVIMGGIGLVLLIGSFAASE